MKPGNTCRSAQNFVTSVIHSFRLKALPILPTGNVNTRKMTRQQFPSCLARCRISPGWQPQMAIKVLGTTSQLYKTKVLKTRCRGEQVTAGESAQSKPKTSTSMWTSPLVLKKQKPKHILGLLIGLKIRVLSTRANVQQAIQGCSTP
jgi:hypothetical protein